MNERREINEKINFEEEFKKLVNIETEKQINKLDTFILIKLKKHFYK